MSEPAHVDAPLYEIIYRVLRQHIAERRFPIGLVLSESTVSRAFNTSRIPAAAALKRLFDDGLVKDSGGRGFVVGDGVAGRPVRRELLDAGLVLPRALKDGLAVRNRGARIYPYVEHAVASCLAHGRFMLNESALAEHYGVSRAIAHEVLTKLERTGIVARDSNQRWYAGPLTADLVRQHFEMRWTLEPVALAQAAAKLDRGDLMKKRERLRDLGRGPRRPAMLERVERDLHIDVVGQCENALLRETVRRSQLTLIATHTTFHRLQHDEEIVTMAAEHGAIFDRLIAGRVAAAAGALEAHLRRSLEPNIALLKSLGPLPASACPPYLVPEH
jgi:DNA-binding GntR family transcriptional regulator